MLRCGENGFAATSLGAAAVVIAALLACGALVYWARRPGHPDRGLLLVAAATLGVVTGVLNLVLGTTGIWQSCSYQLPLPVVASYYLLLPIVGGAVVLAGYRWLTRHVRRAGLLYGAFLLVVVAPLIAIGDNVALENGILAMGGGYTVWMDVVLGVALFSVPVGVYERLRSQSGRARSMVALQNSVHIAGPVAEVFAYLVNPATWSSWDATVKKATPSELPLRVGTRIRTQMQLFLGRTREMERRVIVYEPGTRFVTESLKPFPLTITWTFAPENAGTRVVRDGEVKASAIASLLLLVLQRTAWRTQQASLERMKTLLEARRSEAPTS